MHGDINKSDDFMMLFWTSGVKWPVQYVSSPIMINVWLIHSSPLQTKARHPSVGTFSLCWVPLSAAEASRVPQPTEVSSHFNMALAGWRLDSSVNTGFSFQPQMWLLLQLCMCLCPANPGYTALSQSFLKPASGLDALKPFILHLQMENLSTHTLLCGAVL